MKSIFLTLMFLPFLLWNCKSFDERTKFDVTYINRVKFDSINTKIESGTLFSDTLIMNFAEDVDNHDSKLSKIEYVRMTSFSIELDRQKSGNNENMNFLKSVECYQLGNNNTEILVAKSDTIPKNKGYFEIGFQFESDKDFEDLLTNDISIYKVIYKTNQKLNESVVLKFAAKYEVDTKKVGI